MSCQRYLFYLGTLWIALCVEFVTFSVAVPLVRAQSLLVSVTFPPTDNRGAPARTAGAGQRSVNLQCASSQLPLTVLAPADNVGTTVSARPSLFWYVPQTQAKSAEFIVFEGRDKEVYRTTLVLDGTPGILELSIPEAVYLETGKNYRWFFGLVCNPMDRGEDLFVEGKLQRTQLSFEQNSKLAEATEPLEKARVYAQAKIWQETLNLLAQLRRERPRDVKVAEAWEELLDSVQLKALATEPLVDCCRADESVLSMKPTAAKPEAVGVNEISFYGSRPYNRRNIWLEARIVFPEQNPKQSRAYGEYDPQLSLYEAQMAKMFELTERLCELTNAGYYGINGFVWDYWADAGKNRIGKYRISCTLARDIGLAYGHGNQHRYRIRNWSSGGAVDEYEVAALQINGGKIPKWRSFLQKIRSER